MFNVELQDLHSENAHDFYRENAHESIEKLLLKFAKSPLEKALTIQLDARKRATQKIPEWSQNSKIVFPPKRNLSQASSTATAKYKASLLSYKKSADLTAGTGIDSWQFALKAEQHIAVEPSADLQKLLKHNFQSLGLKNVAFQQKTAEEFLEENQQHFDLIFIDPSRRNEDGKKVISLENYAPNVVELLPKLLSMANNILIKVSPFADLSYLKNLFSNYIQEVHVISYQHECKEILLNIANKIENNPTVFLIDLSSNITQHFMANWDDLSAPVQMAESVSKYIFEPNSSVLKAQAFGAICQKTGVEKLAQNSHLFTSQNNVIDFPGKAFEVVEVAAPYKLKTDIKNGSVISRGFPEKSEKIKAKLNLKEGNSYRIFATKIGAKKVFIATKPIGNH